MFEKILFKIAFLFTLTVPAVLAFMGKDYKTLGIIGGLGVAGMILTNFQNIRSLKLLGVLEAKIDKAEKATTKANATIEQMHTLAATLSKTILFILANAGKWGGGMSAAQKITEKDYILDSLNQIGITKKELKDVTSFFDIDIITNISADLHNMLVHKQIMSTDEAQKLLNPYSVKTLKKVYETYKDTSIPEIQTLLSAIEKLPS